MKKRKQIAVNTRFLIQGKLEGIGLFTLETLREMVQLYPEVDFTFLFDRSFDDTFIFAPNVKGVVLSPPARHPFLWFIWHEWSVKNWLKKNKPDLFLSMDGMTTLHTEIPRVTVIHDLAYKHFSDHVSVLVLKYYQYFVPKFILVSTKIAAVSEFTKQDIVKIYCTAAEKIAVVYNAPKAEYKPISESEKLTIKNEITGGKDFFLYVGSIHPRKNIVRLLQAFELFKTAVSSDTKLVLIGRKAWKFEEVDITLASMKHRQDVVFLGYQSPERTAQITAAALSMCYVSLFEGFGIPIVEAQQAGVPVITSDVTSMPEVAGDSAILVSPTDINAIAQAMERLYRDKNLQQYFIAKGFENVQRFSWKKSAEKLWAICEETINKFSSERL